MADQEQLQPGNDGAPSAGESSTGSSRSFPGLGHVRCYWAIMDAMMNFRYLDPILQEHMQEVSLSPRRARSLSQLHGKGRKKSGIRRRYCLLRCPRAFHSGRLATRDSFLRDTALLTRRFSKGFHAACHPWIACVSYSILTHFSGLPHTASSSHARKESRRLYPPRRERTCQNRLCKVPILYYYLWFCDSVRSPAYLYEKLNSDTLPGADTQDLSIAGGYWEHRIQNPMEKSRASILMRMCITKLFFPCSPLNTFYSPASGWLAVSQRVL